MFRMPRRRPLQLLAVLAVLSVTVGLAPAAGADLKAMRVGVEGAYPPFSEVGPDGKSKGFDIDIAEAVCARLQSRCVLVQQDFDGLIPALQARKFDMIVASMSITPERLKAVAFSDKYYSTPARLVAKKGTSLQATPDGLKGKRIGVQRATTFDRYATDNFTTAQLVRYTKQDEVYLDLAAGRVDAVLADSVATIGGFLKTPQGQGYAFTGPVYNDPKYFGVGAGIALRQSDTALKQQINDALKAMRADGSYKKIQDRYFDFDVYGEEPKR